MERHMFFWSSLPGLPKKIKWPVRMIKLSSTKPLVFCQSDKAYFTVSLAQLVPFPNDIETFTNKAKAAFKKKPTTLQAFTADVEWANEEACCDIDVCDGQRRDGDRVSDGMSQDTVQSSQNIVKESTDTIHDSQIGDEKSGDSVQDRQRRDGDRVSDGMSQDTVQSSQNIVKESTDTIHDSQIGDEKSGDSVKDRQRRDGDRVSDGMSQDTVQSSQNLVKESTDTVHESQFGDEKSGDSVQDRQRRDSDRVIDGMSQDTVQSSQNIVKENTDTIHDSQIGDEKSGDSVQDRQRRDGDRVSDGMSQDTVQSNQNIVKESTDTINDSQSGDDKSGDTVQERQRNESNGVSDGMSRDTVQTSQTTCIKSINASDDSDSENDTISDGKSEDTVCECKRRVSDQVSDGNSRDASTDDESCSSDMNECQKAQDDYVSDSISESKDLQLSGKRRLSLSSGKLIKNKNANSDCKKRRQEFSDDSQTDASDDNDSENDTISDRKSEDTVRECKKRVSDQVIDGNSRDASTDDESCSSDMNECQKAQDDYVSDSVSESKDLQLSGKRRLSLSSRKLIKNKNANYDCKKGRQEFSDDSQTDDSDSENDTISDRKSEDTVRECKKRVSDQVIDGNSRDASTDDESCSSDMNECQKAQDDYVSDSVSESKDLQLSGKRRLSLSSRKLIKNKNANYDCKKGRQEFSDDSQTDDSDSENDTISDRKSEDTVRECKRRVSDQVSDGNSRDASTDDESCSSDMNECQKAQDDYVSDSVSESKDLQLSGKRRLSRKLIKNKNASSDCKKRRQEFSDDSQTDSERSHQLKMARKKPRNSSYDERSHNKKQLRHSVSFSVNKYQKNFEKKRDRKNHKIFIRGLLTSAYNKAGEKKKNDRVWNQVHSCKFCFRKGLKNFIKTNISKHLRKSHRTEPIIKDILRETKNHGPKSKLVRAMWDLIRNLGDHENNTKVMEDGKGEIILGRRYSGKLDLSSYGPCPMCFVWIKTDGKSLYRHQDTCPARVVNPSEKESTKVLRIKALQLSGKISPVASKLLRDEVFPIMTRDEITAIAQSDPLIISLGNMWLLKNIGNRLKRKYYTSSHMRAAARLLVNLRHVTDLEGGFAEHLSVKHFDDVVKATLMTSSADFDDDEDLTSPSTAIKMGYDIKRLIGAKWGIALRADDDEASKDCKDFLKLMKFEWNIKVTKLATVILQTRRFNLDRTLPEPDDLFKLQRYIKEEIKRLDLSEYSYKTYRMAEILAQTRLLMYNKRRSGEVEVIRVKDYLRRQTGVSSIDKVMRAELTELEMKLLETQDLMEVRGKFGRGVPVIVPADVKPVLDYLVNARARDESGVNSSNKYLFPNTSVGVIRAYDSLKVLCKKVELQKPDKITSVSLRKYTATVSQVFDLSSQQQTWLTNHLGHTLDIHKIHYRQTSGVIERIDMAKLMLLQELNITSRYAGKKLQDIQIPGLVFGEDEECIEDTDQAVLAGLEKDEVLEDCNVEDPDYQPGVIEDDNFDEYNFDEAEEDPAKRKARKPSTRTKWTPKEVQEIHKYFKDNLKARSTPGRRECDDAINKSRQAGGVLHYRNWETIKKKVWNIIQKV